LTCRRSKPVIRNLKMGRQIPLGVTGFPGQRSAKPARPLILRLWVLVLRDHGEWEASEVERTVRESLALGNPTGAESRSLILKPQVSKSRHWSET
jgi:hypothetical protein